MRHRACPAGNHLPPKTGSISGPGIAYKIVVWRGSVSCRKARSLIKATGEGKGTWHEARDIAGDLHKLPRRLALRSRHGRRLRLLAGPAGRGFRARG